MLGRVAMASYGAGTVVDGKYRIVRALGEGGMGFVYVAEHVFLKKNMALKMLRPEAAREAGLSARFEQEARATSLLEHENVVRVTDFGRTRDDELYLVMELLDGHALADELARDRRIETGRALWIATQVARGLEAAQARDIVHRDLKPENVFIAARPDGVETVKLVDFGLAKMVQPGGVRLTTTGTVMGTPLYMAPEQVMGQPDLDGRVDVHACGVMLYEMLSGRTPYEGETYGQIAHAILNGRPLPLREVAPHVAPALDALVMKALASDRAARFPTATALREAIEEVAGVPISTAPAPERAAVDPWSSADARAAANRRKQVAATADFGPPQVSEPSASADTPLSSPALAPPSAAFKPPPSAAFAAPAPPPALQLSVEDSQPLAIDRGRHSDPAHPLELDRGAAGGSPARGRGGAIAALALVLAIGGGVWLVAKRHPAVVVPERVHVQVIDLPPGSRVFLDGNLSQPSFDLPGSTVKHRLRLEARGFSTRLLLVDATSDQVVDGHLDPLR